MATRISEYAVPSVMGPGVDMRIRRTTVPAEYLTVEQAAFTASSTPATSTTFSSSTTLVCVQSDEAVYVKVGVSPAVTTNSYRIPAGNEQWFTVSPGAGYAAQVRT